MIKYFIFRRKINLEKHLHVLVSNQFTLDDRLKLHFGEVSFKENKMGYDFDEMKSTYKSYYLWNPKNRFVSEELEPIEAKRKDSMFNYLKVKSET